MLDHARQLDRVTHLPVVQTPGRWGLALERDAHAPSAVTRPYDVTLGRTGFFTQRVELSAIEFSHQVGDDLDRDGDHLAAVDALKHLQAGKEVRAKPEIAAR